MKNKTAANVLYLLADLWVAAIAIFQGFLHVLPLLDIEVIRFWSRTAPLSRVPLFLGIGVLGGTSLHMAGAARDPELKGKAESGSNLMFLISAAGILAFLWLLPLGGGLAGSLTVIVSFGLVIFLAVMCSLHALRVHGMRFPGWRKKGESRADWYNRIGEWGSKNPADNAKLPSGAVIFEPARYQGDYLQKEAKGTYLNLRSA